jgi:hypothetical protein
MTRFAEEPTITRTTRGGKAVDWNRYRDRVRGQFDRMLARGEACNKLYYLLNLFGTGSTRWSNMFLAQVNAITEALVLRRAVATPPDVIPAGDAVFALQMNLEAKAFYAILRNCVALSFGGLFKPDPWFPDEIVCRKTSVTLSTTAIIRNLTKELRDAGFRFLANEFERTHAKEVAHLRNAVAHATFVFPSKETRERWVLGNYAKTHTRHVGIQPTYLTHREFRDIFRRFFAFRLQFYACYNERRERYLPQQFDFQASNQMKVGEMLSCRFERGDLRVTYRGTPLW